MRVETLSQLTAPEPIHLRDLGHYIEMQLQEMARLETNSFINRYLGFGVTTNSPSGKRSAVGKSIIPGKPKFPGWWDAVSALIIDGLIKRNKANTN